MATPDWLLREESLIGADAVARLQRAAVAVIGLGGVGSFTAEALARAGVGRLLLVDGDVVDVTNLNRQLIATTSTVGQPKAEGAAARVRDIAPDCDVRAVTKFYGEGDEALLDSYDFVADAVDMVSAKIALAVACRNKNIPLISAMGCGNKLDPSAFRVADLAKTQVCPLCRVMRRELRTRGITHLPVVYSEEAPRTPAGTPDGRTPPGSLSFVPGAAGLILAGYIVRTLIGEGDKA